MTWDKTRNLPEALHWLTTGLRVALGRPRRFWNRAAYTFVPLVFAGCADVHANIARSNEPAAKKETAELTGCGDVAISAVSGGLIQADAWTATGCGYVWRCTRPPCTRDSPGGLITCYHANCVVMRQTEVQRDQTTPRTRPDPRKARIAQCVEDRDWPPSKCAAREDAIAACMQNIEGATRADCVSDVDGKEIPAEPAPRAAKAKEAAETTGPGRALTGEE